MGFFQSLKDDLSSAMNELINDENEELVNAEDGTEYSEEQEVYSDSYEEPISDEEVYEDMPEENISEELYSDEDLNSQQFDELNDTQEEFSTEAFDQGIMDLVSMEPEEPRSARNAINALKAAGKRLEKKQLQEALDNGALGGIIDDDNSLSNDASNNLETELNNSSDDFDVEAMLNQLDLDSLVSESKDLEINNQKVEDGVQLNIDDILGSLADEDAVTNNINENSDEVREAVDIDDLLASLGSMDKPTTFSDSSLVEPSLNANSIETPIEEPIESSAETAMKETAIEETTMKETAIEENVIEEAAIEEAVIEEATINDPVIEEAALEKVSIDAAAIDESLTKEAPAAESIIVEAPVQDISMMNAGSARETVSNLNTAVKQQTVRTQTTAHVAAKTVSHKQPADTPVLMPNVPAYVPKISNEFSDETAVITKGMRVVGNVASNGNMDVYGTIVGDITIIGKLSVSGTIVGKSKAHEVFADGAEINGDINVTGTVKVGQSSVIIGNISSTSAVIAGAVKGDIDVQGPVVLDSSAIVMGNIKSMSVQINNGAVIEGLCSQCYAQVSPTSFFDDFKKSASMINRK